VSQMANHTSIQQSWFCRNARDSSLKAESVGRQLSEAHCATCFECATRSCLDAGGCPAAGYFILLAQNISNQTKGHPAAPALRATFGLTVKLGGCATRPSRAHKTCPAAELEQCSPSSQFDRQTEAVQKGIWVLWARSRPAPPLPGPLPVGARGWCCGVVVIPSPSRGRPGWGWDVFDVRSPWSAAE